MVLYSFVRFCICSCNNTAPIAKPEPSTSVLICPSSKIIQRIGSSQSFFINSLKASSCSSPHSHFFFPVSGVKHSDDRAKSRINRQKKLQNPRKFENFFFMGG